MACIIAEESEEKESDADSKNQQGGDEVASHIRNSNEDTSDNFNFRTILRDMKN